MSVKNVFMDESLMRWLHDTDEHASYRMELLKQVDAVLSHQDDAPQQDDQTLANKLEQWRYRLLRDVTQLDSPHVKALADTLDNAASRLAGYSPRRPRNVRSAIDYHTCKRSGDSFAEAEDSMSSDRMLDDVVQQATEITCKHFSLAGDTSQRHMALYAPLYVSNECVNFCTYCGFRFPRKVVREHLTLEESIEQARILYQRGFRRVLIVAGEYPQRTTVPYFTQLIEALVEMKITPSIEIAPQSVSGYASLRAAGAKGLALYQETYDPISYAKYHPRGPKSAFLWRLEAPERAAEAGIEQLGLGTLLGLADPEKELRALMRHGAYLVDRFPNIQLAFSLPRIHDAPDEFVPPWSVPDEQLIRFYCALRIAFPRADLVLSTRESVSLRNRMAKTCITRMSAGSCTSPGGYHPAKPTSTEQFPVADSRAPAEVETWLQAEGFKPVWN